MTIKIRLNLHEYCRLVENVKDLPSATTEPCDFEIIMDESMPDQKITKLSDLAKMKEIG